MNIHESFNKLRHYVEAEGYKGWDPYDGLNSRVFRAMPFAKDIKFTRLAWIQAFKRLPLNLRPLLMVKKDYNPKGLGLFLSGYCALFRSGFDRDCMGKITFLTSKIIELRTEGQSGDCWGYNFDWQSRAFFQPKYTPTIVATVFISNALLDVYEITKDESLLRSAESSCRFILNDLNRTYDEHGDFAFSYSPLDNTQVFNASLLGSKLLSRVYSYTKDKELIDAASASVRFCLRFQQENGAWAYGTLPFQQWVDNFHTGYNLECIYDYMKYSGDESCRSAYELGMKYYLNTFFTDEGISKYYNDSVYPIDIHAPAELVAALYRTKKLRENKDLVDRVLFWTMENMQDERGYFYYQLKNGINSTIPYMRWAQGWMFYALCLYLEEFNDEK